MLAERLEQRQQDHKNAVEDLRTQLQVTFTLLSVSGYWVNIM